MVVVSYEALGRYIKQETPYDDNGGDQISLTIEPLSDKPSEDEKTKHRKSLSNGSRLTQRAQRWRPS